MADLQTIIHCDSNNSAFPKNLQESKDLGEMDKTNVSVSSKTSGNETEIDMVQNHGETITSGETVEDSIIVSSEKIQEKSSVDIDSHQDSKNSLKINDGDDTSNQMELVNMQCLGSLGKDKAEKSEDKVQLIKLVNLDTLCTKTEDTAMELLKSDQFIGNVRELSCNNPSRDLSEENDPKLCQEIIDIESKVVNDHVKETVNMTETRVECDNSSSAFPRTAQDIEDYEEKNKNKISAESKTICNIIVEETDILYIQNQTDIQNTPEKAKGDLKLSNPSNDIIQDEAENIQKHSKISKDHKDSNVLKINPNDERSVWISNINPTTTAKNLKLDLSKFGKVVTAKIVSNGDRYYGYALMENIKYSDVCIEKLNGTILNGYMLEVGRETPSKKKGNLKDKKNSLGNEKKDVKKGKDPVEDLKVVKVEKDVKARDINKRKRSSSVDPLTLKVETKRRVKENERRSKNVEQKSKRRPSFNHKCRLTKEQELQLKKQKQFEMEIAIEKKKLAINKQKFEREKLEFLRLQTRFEEERVKQEREKASKAREDQKERDSLISRRRRSKSPKLYRKEQKPEKSEKHYDGRSSKDIRPLKRPLLESPKKGNPIPVLHRGYRDDKRYFEVKIESDYAKYGRVDPPPPPRLTNDDLNTCKSKSYVNKKIIKREFSPMSDINLGKTGYLRKDEERKHRRLAEFDRRFFENDPRRYSSVDARKYSGLDRKHSENERRYSEGYYYKECDKHKNYKMIYEESKMLPMRSEISIPSARSNFQYPGNNESRNVSYPVQYRNYPPPPVEYHVPLQHINGPNIHNNWNDHLKRPLYQKDQQSTHARPFHQENKYDGYDKKHQYLDFGRKY